ncbi:MAG TPA: hypothetical protein PLP89_06725 [Synergistales bacterium]|jgi:hypothetical protein|nr:hypothetical protein [Synergistales bacterium]HRV71456.1 hypothetical protein [Thermovirgaceae bacterium]
MNHTEINVFRLTEQETKRLKAAVPAVGATLLLLFLVITCGETSVTEAAFPLLFLPLVSLTSFVISMNRAEDLLGDMWFRRSLQIAGAILAATLAESLPFFLFFRDWGLNWMPFIVGVILASAISGLFGAVSGALFPGKGSIASWFAAAFLQTPSLTGFALIRHPGLFLLPNQAALDLLDGAFGPLNGIDLMLPLITGTLWITAGIFVTVLLRRARTPSRP